MSMYRGIVEFNWSKLEGQPLYVKSERKENAKQGYRMELAIDRSSEDDNLRGESFFVYGRGIEDIKENKDVVIKVNPDLSSFMSQDFGGFMPYIVVEFAKEKSSLGTSYAN